MNDLPSLIILFLVITIALSVIFGVMLVVFVIFATLLIIGGFFLFVLIFIVTIFSDVTKSNSFNSEITIEDQFMLESFYNFLEYFNIFIKSKVFISYRRSTGTDISGRMYDRLILNFHENRLFKDVYDIPPGIDFTKFIEKSIRRSKILLLIIGNDWISSKRLNSSNDPVRIEVELALKHNVRIIPVLTSGTKMPETKELPISIRQISNLNALEVRGDPDFHGDMDRMINKLTNK